MSWAAVCWSCEGRCIVCLLREADVIVEAKIYRWHFFWQEACLLRSLYRIMVTDFVYFF